MEAREANILEGWACKCLNGNCLKLANKGTAFGHPAGLTKLSSLRDYDVISSLDRPARNLMPQHGEMVIVLPLLYRSGGDLGTTLSEYL